MDSDSGVTVRILGSQPTITPEGASFLEEVCVSDPARRGSIVAIF